MRLLGVLIGNNDPRTKLDFDIRELLIKRFGKDFLFETVIARSVKHREATVYGKTVIEYAPTSQSAEQFRSLAREVMVKLELATAPNEKPQTLKNKEVANG